MIYIVRPYQKGHACLKVMNSRGEELSVSFDDSAGALHDLSRVSMARFNGPRYHRDMIGQEEPVYSPYELLKALADHLGYELYSAGGRVVCQNKLNFQVDSDESAPVDET